MSRLITNSPAKDVNSIKIIFAQREIINYCLQIFFIGCVSFEINNIKNSYK